ncbi:MAG TPA: ribosome biogenesis GTPase YlqF [Bacilli bacterium]|nr:ribosome biogenesis GTPase YlqF [Bacilli bacterium]
MVNNRVKNLHWFPGHMAKALREVEAKCQSVDIIIEICDARIPHSSRNPFLSQVAQNKKRLLILNKADMADASVTKAWIKHLNTPAQMAIATSLSSAHDLKIIRHSIDLISVDKRERDQKRGMKNRPIKALVIGIPNSGKSTFINRLAGRKKVLVANRPGATRAQQYIKIDQDIELIDTPGILPPNYEDSQVALNLALLKAIPMDILPLNELCEYAIKTLVTQYPNYLTRRYGEALNGLTNYSDILLAISKIRGYLPLGADNFERAEKLLVVEFQNGILGAISLERPSDD